MAEEEKKPDQATEETKEEKLFAGKYKTAEELEKAYKESEKAFHEKSQKAADAEKQLKELQEEKEEKETVTEETNTELDGFEYPTKTDVNKALEQQKKDFEEQRKKDRAEIKEEREVEREIDKIMTKYPGLSITTIQQVANTYPDETDFGVAFGKFRDQQAEELGLHTETQVTTKEVNIPSNLIGAEDLGVETEDRSRITRMREAGNTGNISSHVKKK